MLHVCTASASLSLRSPYVCVNRGMQIVKSRKPSLKREDPLTRRVLCLPDTTPALLEDLLGGCCRAIYIMLQLREECWYQDVGIVWGPTLSSHLVATTSVRLLYDRIDAAIRLCVRVHVFARCLELSFCPYLFRARTKPKIIGPDCLPLAKFKELTTVIWSELARVNVGRQQLKLVIPGSFAHLMLILFVFIALGIEIILG